MPFLMVWDGSLPYEHDPQSHDSSSCKRKKRENRLIAAIKSFWRTLLGKE